MMFVFITDSTDMNTSMLAMRETVTFECRKDFYREKNSDICVPSCYTWKQDTDVVSVVIDAMNILSATLGLVSTIAIFIFAIFKEKSMYACYCFK